MKVGVLALQGDFREHARTLSDAGATPREVRTVADLAEVDRLIIPGGESTTIGKLSNDFGLLEACLAGAGSPPSEDDRHLLCQIT